MTAAGRGPAWPRNKRASAARLRRLSRVSTRRQAVNIALSDTRAQATCLFSFSLPSTYRYAELLLSELPQRPPPVPHLPPRNAREPPRIARAPRELPPASAAASHRNLGRSAASPQPRQQLHRSSSPRSRALISASVSRTASRQRRSHGRTRDSWLGAYLDALRG